MAITSVPVRTNPELRESRLFNSIASYIKKSMLTILRALLMYRPLACLTAVGAIPFLAGFGLGIRFLIFYFNGRNSGHIQSLILACTLMIMGFMTFVIGMLADVLSANRKIIEDVQYHIRKLTYDKTDTKVWQEAATQALQIEETDLDEVEQRNGTSESKH